MKFKSVCTQVREPKVGTFVYINSFYADNMLIARSLPLFHQDSKNMADVWSKHGFFMPQYEPLLEVRMRVVPVQHIIDYYAWKAQNEQVWKRQDELMLKLWRYRQYAATGLSAIKTR